MEWIVFLAGIIATIYLSNDESWYSRPKLGDWTPIVVILIIPVIMVVMIEYVLK